VSSLHGGNWCNSPTCSTHTFISNCSNGTLDSPVDRLLKTVRSVEPSFRLWTEWLWEILLQLRITHRWELVVSSCVSIHRVWVDHLNLSFCHGEVLHPELEFFFSSIA
jgi:hypothetical protein